MNHPRKRIGFVVFVVLLCGFAAFGDGVSIGPGRHAEASFADNGASASGDGGTFLRGLSLRFDLSAALAFPLLYNTAVLQASSLGAELNSAQTDHFAKAVRWMKYSIIALGVNTGALVLSFIDPFAGAIAGIISLGAWSITTGFMAWSYRDLIGSLESEGSDAPKPDMAFYTSIGAAAFAMGALTAINLSFSDTSGVSTALAYICTGVSGVSGIIAIVKTYRYAEEVGYTIERGLSK
jgi:hypothetical protein